MRLAVVPQFGSTAMLIIVNDNHVCQGILSGVIAADVRLRERLLGGVTYNLIHESPVPIVIAH